MITVTLSKKDLLNLVRGTQPELSQIKDFQNRGLGSFTGGHVDKWSWNHYHLKTLDEQKLWDIYEECTREARRENIPAGQYEGKFPLTKKVKEGRDIGDDVIPMYQDLWRATERNILKQMTEAREDAAKSRFLSILKKELNRDVIHVDYVSSEFYEKVKEKGPYREATVKGVKLLVEHSWDQYQGVIIIKTPKFENNQ